VAKGSSGQRIQWPKDPVADLWSAGKPTFRTRENPHSRLLTTRDAHVKKKSRDVFLLFLVGKKSSAFRTNRRIMHRISTESPPNHHLISLNQRSPVLPCRRPPPPPSPLPLSPLLLGGGGRGSLIVQFACLSEQP
jgi:hypothetical protein